MSSLASKNCVPCRGGTPALTGIELDRLLREVPHWQIINDHHITRVFTFPDFKHALTGGLLWKAQHPEAETFWNSRLFKICGISTERMKSC